MTKETYEWAVNKLLDAYNERKLFHGVCDACAVGNLFEGNLDWNLLIPVTGIELNNLVGIEPVERQRSFAKKHRGSFKYSLDFIKISEKQKQMGISLKELSTIEHTFETSIAKTEEGYDHWIEHEKEGQYIGLCAVLDVMKDMVKEEVPYKENKEKLTKIYEELIA